MLCIAERAFSILRCRLLALHRRESVLHPLLRDDAHGHLVRVRGRVGVGVGVRIGFRLDDTHGRLVRVRARVSGRVRGRVGVGVRGWGWG